MKIEDSPLNVFSAAAKKGSKTASGKGIPSSPSKAPGIPKRVVDPETLSIINKMHDMHGDLEAQLELLSQKSGLSKENIWRLAEDSKRISQEKFDAIKKKQQELIEKVTGIAGGQSGGAPAATPMGSGKSHKSKLAGSRRNWIPTR
jgi:hypothetical protein